MDTIKKLFRLTAEIFTLGIIIWGIFTLRKSEETIYIVDMFLTLGLIFVILIGIQLNRSMFFSNIILNYLLPYFIVLGLLLLGVYLVNLLNIAKYLDMRIIGTGFTVFYIIYSLISYFFLNRKKDRIRF